MMVFLISERRTIKSYKSELMKTKQTDIMFCSHCIDIGAALHVRVKIPAMLKDPVV